MISIELYLFDQMTITILQSLCQFYFAFMKKIV